ncbi:MAG TPA: VOC family protein [Dinghuibacter sp.]|uniref:VOC family protein n=1 Tax=Dinghuibacter sp. TaxID=2024697 RepID=UPI002B8DF235|nr:VOC family protein [Dinghuibacter sp.]HTJ13295.1 VOC family protein [Dinghuibacter sp.]
MNNGIKIILYPVKDVVEAKATFQQFLGVEPYADQPYYVGFKVGGQDVGLVPGNPEKGMTPFYDVADIKASLQVLVDAGAEVIQDVKNVGGERLIASVRDKSGNLIGLVQG